MQGYDVIAFYRISHDEYPMPIVKLTKSVVEQIPYAATGKGQVAYYDTDLKGFGLVVGAKVKSFIAQKDVNGRTRRITIGRFGTWTVELARREAQLLLVNMDRGIDPIKERRLELAQQVTLEQGLAIHLERIQRNGCVAGTIQRYKESVGNQLRDWLNRPMQEITRSECRARHTHLGETRGEGAANQAMKCLRAIYTTMMKENENILSSPTMGVHWYKEYRRQEPVPDAKLPEWYLTVMAIHNPVRRDLQLFTLFTGLRRNDACTVRWDDINFDQASLHRPNPKGGASRAFTVPLPDVCMEILKRRKRDNVAFFGKDCPWVFPAYDSQGSLHHVVMPYEKRKGLPTPHRLRDTYTTAANAVGLSPYDIDVLTNHRPPMGAVTAGYIRQDFEYLRTQQQKIADYLKTKLKMPPTPDDTKIQTSNVHYLRVSRRERQTKA